MVTCSLPEAEFKILLIGMPNEFWGKIDEFIEFSEEIGNIKMEMENTHKKIPVRENQQRIR